MRLNNIEQLVLILISYRTSSDLERKRDRFECAIDNYPPLENNQTAVAQFIAEYFDAQRFAITSFNISGIYSICPVKL